MKSELNVGIGELKVVKNPGFLTARGLGSCIGVSIYDPLLKLGGMAHILLPESTIFEKTDNPYKFANMAIPALVEALCRQSGNPRRFIVKLAGGAKMFSFSSTRPGGNIGAQNSERVIGIIREMGLTVVAQDVGGTKGRTVSLDTSTGGLIVRVLGSGEKVL